MGLMGLIIIKVFKELITYNTQIKKVYKNIIIDPGLNQA